MTVTQYEKIHLCKITCTIQYYFKPPVVLTRKPLSLVNRNLLAHFRKLSPGGVGHHRESVGVRKGGRGRPVHLSR